MSVDHEGRKELHKKFGIALKENPEILEQIKYLCLNLDLKDKTLKESTRLFSEKLDMPHDYIVRYVNRKISEQIKKRLKEIKNKRPYEIYNDFCRNGKTFEENVSALAEDLRVSEELMFLYAWHFEEAGIVACRLYENDTTLSINLLTSTGEDRQKELEIISQKIKMSSASIEKLLKYFDQ
jgi:hypothetical protein